MFVDYKNTAKASKVKFCVCERFLATPVQRKGNPLSAMAHFELAAVNVELIDECHLLALGSYIASLSSTRLLMLFELCLSFMQLAGANHTQHPVQP